LFPNLLQFVSIQIKQIPSAFKYSLQCFLTIKKHVFKIKDVFE
jgi:hypothetical protein